MSGDAYGVRESAKLFARAATMHAAAVSLERLRRHAHDVDEVAAQAKAVRREAGALIRRARRLADRGA